MSQLALADVPRVQLDRRSRGWGFDANRRRYIREDVHRTPESLFEALHREFAFTLDVAALPDNAMCPQYFTPDDDGLAQDWAPETVWLNPPYSSIEPWMKKAFEESRKGATVVCLVPVRADLGWWHDYAVRGEIRWIRGRLRFMGYGDKVNLHNAPFACCIVIFRPPVSFTDGNEER